MKIKIMIIPVGEQIKPIYEGFKYVKEINKIFLLCTSKTEVFANEIKNKITAIHSDVKIINTSANDFNQICLDLVKNVGGEKPKINRHLPEEEKIDFQVIANITGGTKPMSFASYIFASLYDGYCFYIFKKDNEEMEYVEMPKLSLSFEKVLNYGKTRYKIIGFLKETQENNFTKLAKKVNIKSSSLNTHINILKENRLVETEQRGREKIIKATPTGIMLYCLLRVKNGD